MYDYESLSVRKIGFFLLKNSLAYEMRVLLARPQELKTATKISLTLSSIENQKLVIAEYPNKIKTIKKEGI